MDIKQTLAKYLLDPLFAYHEKSSHQKYLEQYERSQYYPPEKIEEQQFHLLKNLLIHAQKNCPFYTNRFQEAGFDPFRFNSMTELKKIPALTKKDIQANLDTLTASNYLPEQLVENKTGGSTGSPLLFCLDRERLFSRKASSFRHDRWAGWDIGMKTAVLWGHHRDFLGEQNWKSKFRAEYYDRKLILDTSDITSEKLDKFVTALNDYKPEIYVAYANSMFLYARYIKENKIIEFNRPKAIITSAELLTSEQRQLIEGVFDCKVFNRYGCRETSIVASECSEHTGMHISSETLYLEFQKGNKTTETGSKIIITDLLNYGMPLIRYQIEDMGKAVSGDCRCGRTLPRMEISGGRMTDFLITSDNRVISGASMTIYFIATVIGIAQAQLIQRKRNELIIKIVKSGQFSNNTEVEISRKIAEFFGKEMKFVIEYTDNIPTTDSGKYRFSVSELDPIEFLS